MTQGDTRQKDDTAAGDSGPRGLASRFVVKLHGLYG